MSKTVSFEPTMQDFKRLSKYLRQEKGIRELERITPERLKAQYDKGMMIFLFVANCGCEIRKGHPLACVVLWETAKSAILEVGTVWVHPKYRGGSTQKEVIELLLALPAAQGKYLFAISMVSTFGNVVLELGFQAITLKKMRGIKGWARHIGMPEKRIPSSVYRPPDLEPPEGERILFIRFADIDE